MGLNLGNVMLHQFFKRGISPLAYLSSFFYTQTGLAAQPSPAIVKNLTAGDRDCYVRLMNNQGKRN
jgi:hypothetical protein